MFKNSKDLPIKNQDILSGSKAFESYSKSDLQSIKIQSYFSVYD